MIQLISASERQPNEQNQTPLPSGGEDSQEASSKTQTDQSAPPRNNGLYETLLYYMWYKVTETRSKDGPFIKIVTPFSPHI